MTRQNNRSVRQLSLLCSGTSADSWPKLQRPAPCRRSGSGDSKERACVLRALCAECLSLRASAWECVCVCRVRLHFCACVGASAWRDAGTCVFACECTSVNVSVVLALRACVCGCVWLECRAHASALRCAFVDSQTTTLDCPNLSSLVLQQTTGKPGIGKSTVHTSSAAQ
eukprot:4133246-Pleurochrysis_carterae.AAC.1